MRLFFLLSAFCAWSLCAAGAPAFWYWHENPALEKCTRYFRAAFELPDNAASAPVYFACDDRGTIYVNGNAVKRNQHWKHSLVNIAPRLRKGKNIVAFEVKNEIGKGGIIFRGEVLLKNGTLLPLVSDGNIRSAASAPAEWQSPEFDDSSWREAVKLGDPSTKPWSTITDMSPFFGGEIHSATPADPGRIMLDDFADISSWLGGPGKGARPGSAHPFNFNLGSVPDSRRDDGFAGALCFDTVAPGGEARFGKNRIFLLKLRPQAVRFSADAEGHAGEVSFSFVDRFDRVFRTRGVRIEGAGYRDYRLELNADTVPEFDKINFPVAMREIFYRNDAPAVGRILLDDLCYEGDVSDPGRQISIHPDYRKLDHAPGEPIVMSYRLRNGRPEPVELALELKVYDAERKLLLSRKTSVKLDAFGFGRAAFNLGSFERKEAYRVELTASNGKVSHSHNGWLGVFEANNGRVNHVPMYFGVEDQEVNTAPYEAGLHAEWMKTLGVDMIRGGFLGDKAEGVRGGNSGYEGFRKMWQSHVDAGLMICLDYAVGIPGWTGARGKAPEGVIRPMGRDPELFKEHIRHLAEFIRSMPAIRYFEWFNEPNLSGYIKLEEYMESARVLYPILKEVNPRLLVGTGGNVIAPHPHMIPGFNEAAYLANSDFYDIALYHCHDGFNTYKKVTGELKTMLEKRKLDRPVANTEAGARSYQSSPENFYAQARTLVQKIAWSRAAGLEFYVWFMLQDYWDKYINADDSFGLVTVDNQPKPSFLAYNELIRQLAGTVPAEPEELDSRLESCKFVTETEEVHVAWPRQSGAQFSFCLRSEKPVRAIDMFGNVRILEPVNGVIFVNSRKLPFYLRSAKGAATPVGELLRVADGGVRLPGVKEPLTLELVNPFLTETFYSVSVGGETRTGKVAPGKSKTLSFDFALKSDSAPGVRSCAALLELKDAKRRSLFRGELNFRVSVALPVTTEPQLIRLDDESVLTELAFDPTTPRWGGREDLSAEIRVRLRGENLVFEADVRDRDHSVPFRKAMIWRNDAIQLGFAGSGGELTEITVSDTPEGKPVAWRHIAPGGEAAGALDIPLSVHRDGGVTRYRFEIPCRLLRIVPRKGGTFRMALLVTDNDHGKRLRIMEYFSGIESNKEPERFGYCRFR